mmetsp:Transcript_66397/g.130882  ORF Transcript_66397/g.130882 Transcript_66397/m.130882 type:complete len:290 (+) Transcript_66397:376-1245(+)
MPGTELPHHKFALPLIQLGVQAGSNDAATVQLIRQPVHLPPGVAVDDCLASADEALVQVSDDVQLPLLPLHGHVKLGDAFEQKMPRLNEDAHRVAHETSGQIQEFLGHRGGESGNCDIRRQCPEYVVDLVLHPAAQHLIRLVKHEGINMVHAQVPLRDHVVHATGHAYNNLLASAQLIYVAPHRSAANATVATDLQILAKRPDNIIDLDGELTRGRKHQSLANAGGVVNALQHTDDEGGRLSSARLRLGNGIPAVNDWKNGPLLDSGWPLKPVGIYPSEQLLVKVCIVK